MVSSFPGDEHLPAGGNCWINSLLYFAQLLLYLLICLYPNSQVFSLFQFSFLSWRIGGGGRRGWADWASGSVGLSCWLRLNNNNKSWAFNLFFSSYKCLMLMKSKTFGTAVDFFLLQQQDSYYRTYQSDHISGQTCMSSHVSSRYIYSHDMECSWWRAAPIATTFDCMFSILVFLKCLDTKNSGELICRLVQQSLRGSSLYCS